MNNKRMMALFRREMKDIFRDRKTLFMMLVLPILLYPLMIIGMTVLTSSMITQQQNMTYTVAFDDAVFENNSAKRKITALLEDEEKAEYKVEFVQTTDYQTDLAEKNLHAYLTMEADNGKNNYQIYYISTLDDSSMAASIVAKALEGYRDHLRSEKLIEAGLTEDSILEPILFERMDLSTTEESAGHMLGSFIPLLVIISVCLGALYPAIDVTAGERERGTLETLLTLPVTNFEMIMSKFMAVGSIAIISTLLSLISIGGSMFFMLATFSDQPDMGFEVNIASFLPAVLFTALVLIIFAMFATAVSMCVCIFAKSFKEANNYITPVLLIFMFGSMVTMLPKFELTAITAAIPVVNVSLMIKDIFKFQYNYALFGIVLLSNVAYSLLTIMALAKIYNSEQVLFAEGSSNIKLLSKRSEMKPKQIPGVGDSMLLICVVLLLVLYIGTAATVKLGFGGVAVNQAIILLVPLLFAWYVKADFKKLFSLKKPSINGVMGSIFFVLGGLLVNIALGYLLSFVFTDSYHAVDETFSQLVDQPFLLLLFVVAVMPAVGEELMFRGFVYGSLREKCKPYAAILITSAIFGIYHMSLIKFFTTSFLGLLLVLLVYKTGSIIPGMIMHFLNNAIALFTMKYEKELVGAFDFLNREAYTAVEIITMIAAGFMLLALGWIFIRTKKNEG